MEDALTDLWRSVLLFAPKAVAFIAILIVGYFVAKAVRGLVNKVLERVGFDRAVQRGGIGRALERTELDASDILAKLAYYAVLLFTLQLAFGIWGPNPISDLIEAVVAWLPRAFVAIIIVVVATAIAGAVRDLVQGALGGLSYGRLLASIASIFIIGLGVIAALNQIGIATTVTTPVLIAALATVAGILIVGVGGGLVRPMQRRWETWLERAAVESSVIRERALAYAAEREAARVERASREEQVRREEEAARDEAASREGELRLAELADNDARAYAAGQDDLHRELADRTDVIPRQDDESIRATQVIAGGPPQGDDAVQATQVIPGGSGQGLYQSGNAQSGNVQPGPVAGPTAAEPTQPVPPAPPVRDTPDDQSTR